MADSDQIYEIALSMVKRISVDIVMEMSDRGVTPEEFFTMETPELSRALGLNPGMKFERMDRDEALFRARKEAEFMDKKGIKGYFLLNPDYPTRLFQVPDAPIYLYQYGDTDLESEHMVSIVGTRHQTMYGANFCQNLVSDLAAYFPDLVVVSGLAYGVDASAHMAALTSNVKTVAVVAHGLDRIYPTQHRDLAHRMVDAGGSILSEYPIDTEPYRQRFLERNRIVAALSEVTVVAESDIRGGAMSTANTAFHYSREVMALPGRISDQYSSGCNLLIRQEKAHLITCAADLIEQTGWRPLDVKVTAKQRNLFPELEGEAKLIYETLQFAEEPMQIDRLHMVTLIPINRLTATLGEMEFDGIVARHPGNRYSIS